MRRRRPVAPHGHVCELFARHGLLVAQVLLTHDDLEHHERHLNARNTLVTLLGRGVVPIINENDAVSFTEIKFGDNDKLSALVASLLPADLLVILTTVDGVIENFGRANPQTIPVIEKIDSAMEKLARRHGQRHRRRRHDIKNRGRENRRALRHPARHRIGQKEKCAGENSRPAKTKARCSSRNRQNCRAANAGLPFSIIPTARCSWMTARNGRLREKGKSLLPPGVARCEGEFAAGDVVRICDLDGTEFARGIARFDAAAVRARKLPKEELVHRDDLVIL